MLEYHQTNIHKYHNLMITIPDKDTLRQLLSTVELRNCHWAMKFLPGQILEQRIAGETLEVQGLALGLLLAIRRSYEDASVPGASINMMDTYAMLQSLPAYIETFVPEDNRDEVYKSMIEQAPAIYLIGPSSLKTRTNRNELFELLNSSYPERRTLNDELLAKLLPQEKVQEWKVRSIDVTPWMTSSRTQINVHVTVKAHGLDASIDIRYSKKTREFWYRKGTDFKTYSLPGSILGITEKLHELIEKAAKVVVEA